jgi:hypothetical protein
MKKQFVIAVAFIAVTGITNNLDAQETSAKKGSSNWDLATSKGGVAKIVPIEDGCAISFNIKSPRDAASGMASGKRQHKPTYIVRSSDNSITEAKNPGDLAAGRSSGTKATIQDLSATMACRKYISIVITDGEFTIPSDCPDGEHDLSVSWSWGVSNNTGRSSKTCTVKFKVTMKDGACIAIDETGVH